MTQPASQHSELVWNVFETRNQEACETRFMVQEAASPAKKHLQTPTEVSFVLVRYAKAPSLFFTNFSSSYDSNVFSTWRHL